MMRFVLMSWVCLVCLESFASSQQDLWSGQALPLKPFLLDSSDESSSDYDRPSSSSSRQNTLKKRVAMGVDLPDYILHYRGKSPDLGSFRERMQLSGRR